MNNWLVRFLKGELGFKTIAGALLILLSLILEVTGHPSYADPVMRFGEFLGVVGIRDALAKLKGP